jgi:general secretion pathway protein L
LRRELQLPAQVKNRLRSALGYELDRLTPFRADEVFYDARVVGTQGTQLRIELALCPREQVLPYLDRLRDAGIRVARLTWPNSWPRANLLPLSERPRPKRLGTFINLLLALVIVILSGALLATPLWQGNHEREQLERQLEDLRSRAATVAALREELEKVRASNMNVVQRSREAPRMSDLLRELTDRFPDGTWVQTLNYRDGAVDMRGQSTQATALIALLEQAPGISAVTFRSPVMQIASTNTERFHIAFDYRRPESQ